MIFSSKTANGDPYAVPRKAMVEKQLVARGIKDERVLKAMSETPRHLFVPDAFRSKAYSDSALPIGKDQTISQPYMVAIMTELLELEGNEKVLEIGTGSGYQTAILSRLAGNVFSLERIAPLLFESRKVLESLDYHNVALRVSDGTLGWKDFAPYDCIIVTAGGPEAPQPLFDQLKIGGKLIIPVGGHREQELYKYVKSKNGMRHSKHLPCTFVKLVGEYGWKEKE